MVKNGNEFQSVNYSILSVFKYICILIKMCNLKNKLMLAIKLAIQAVSRKPTDNDSFILIIILIYRCIT